MAYKTQEQRIAEIDAYLREHGPAGCIVLSKHFQCSRPTIQMVITASGKFKLVQKATDGPYGTEALYDVLDSERPAVVIETPANPCPWWPTADQVIERAMRAMIMEKV